LGYLLSPVVYAEFALYPKLVIAANMDQTVRNIAVHAPAFAGMASCYLVTLLEDILIAWALYVFLTPVNRGLSLLASLFRYVYATVALLGVFDLFIAYRLVNGGKFAASLSAGELHAQVALLLASFRYEWPVTLIVFGVHLGLIGYLIVRSTYVPKWLGAVLIVDGVYWVVNGLQPYFFPNANIHVLFYFTFSELILMVWLLGWGSRVREPAMRAAI
jgi:hypothetical protein